MALRKVSLKTQRLAKLSDASLICFSKHFSNFLTSDFLLSNFPKRRWIWKLVLLWNNVAFIEVINRNYIDANHVATWMWTPIYSWYDWISFRGKGLIAANQPWSGYYNASGNTPIWALAHTSQFTKPGWNFLGDSFNCSYRGSPCGSIGDNSTSGSYVTYISEDQQDM